MEIKYEEQVKENVNLNLRDLMELRQKLKFYEGKTVFLNWVNTDKDILEFECKHVSGFPPLVVMMDDNNKVKLMFRSGNIKTITYYEELDDCLEVRIDFHRYSTLMITGL